jgi:hypothetical protein
MGLLDKIYTTPGSGGSFAGERALFEEARKREPRITLEDVRYYLSTKKTYTLHAPAIRRFPRLKFIPAGLGTDFQADLAIMSSIASENKGNRYILVLVELLSRRLYAYPVRVKDAVEMTEAFKRFLADLDYPPWNLVTDQGTEFKNKNVQALLRANNVRWSTTHSNPRVKAAVAERAIRTLKSRLYRVFTERGNNCWIDILQPIVNDINNSKNSTIGMAPNEVNTENARELWYKIYGEERFTNSKKLPRFSIGDPVRFQRQKGIFEKGYTTNYTTTYYFVAEVRRRPVITYRLRSTDGQIVKGWFYERELIRVDASQVPYRIERVLESRVRNRRKEHLVKWRGFPSVFNSWIPDATLIRK